MADFYLKNTTGNSIEVADLGIIIENNQSITIPENDFDGWLTEDLINALGDDASSGLILSTTDIGDTSGDYPKAIAIEKLSLQTKWRPPVNNEADLPTAGNEDGEIRLVTDTGILYRWKNSTSSWEQITSNFALTVKEYDNDPTSNEVDTLVFVQAEDSVYIDNNVAYIGPPDAPISVQDFPLTINKPLYEGRLAQGYLGSLPSGVNYGDSINYILKNADIPFTLELNETNGFNFGDKGILKIKLNGNDLAVIDLEANFEEVNRTTAQNLSHYNTTGAGYPISGGIVNFVNGGGTAELLYVQQYNNFKFYQIWGLRLNFTDENLFISTENTRYNYITVEHINISSPQTSQTFNIFIDDSSIDVEASTPIITIGTPNYNYLSGVKFFGANSTFNVEFNVVNAFKNTYHISNAPVVLSGWPGLPNTNLLYTDSSVSGVSNPPQISETMAVSGYVITQTTNQLSEDARLTVTPRDPFGDYTPVTSASNKFMIFSYSPQSDDLNEYFIDEIYRLPDGDYNTIPTTITGQWDSTTDLTTLTSPLQVYMGQLIYPDKDYSVYQPSGNPNYNGAFSGTLYYYRAFRDTAHSHANGTLNIEGITKQDLINGKLTVHIKAPGLTGWLDLSKDFNASEFSGSDGDGCWIGKSDQINSEFKFSLGTFYTENSGHMIIVRIGYPDKTTAPTITNLSIIDW